MQISNSVQIFSINKDGISLQAIVLGDKALNILDNSAKQCKIRKCSLTATNNSAWNYDTDLIFKVWSKIFGTAQ